MTSFDLCCYNNLSNREIINFFASNVLSQKPTSLEILIELLNNTIVVKMYIKIVELFGFQIISIFIYQCCKLFIHKIKKYNLEVKLIDFPIKNDLVVF